MAKHSANVQSLSAFAWSIADILRGDFKQSEYGKVILPFVVLRRLDCLLEASKKAVLKAAETLPDGVDDATRDMILFGAVGGNVKVYNLSRFTFDTLKGQDARQLHANLVDYITNFSANVRDIFLDKFLFTDQLKRLKDGEILWPVFEKFCQIDLHPDRVSNVEMGYLFEELIRRFSEISNETAGEHFTPREVIRLIVDLLIANDDEKLTGRGIIRQVYDPACGTGGMLALTEEALKEFNSSIRVELFGQELNGESFGICKSDMLVTGHDPEQIAFGNTLTQDAHKGTRAAHRIHDALMDRAGGSMHADATPEQLPLLLKALLVHGARWSDKGTMLDTFFGPQGQGSHLARRDDITRIFGYGVPDIQRVIDCTENRATLLGAGTITADSAVLYRIPLPDGLEGVRALRSLTTTLAWFSPVNPRHQGYRMAALDISAAGDDRYWMAESRASAQPTDKAIVRGTVCHEWRTGEDARVFVDDGHLLLRISCRASAGALETAVPYALAVSFEIAVGAQIQVYDEVRARLTVPVRAGAA